MVQEWLANGVFLYLMAGVCGVGIVFKLLLTGYYGRQMRQTLNVNEAKKKWLLKMRQDYEKCMDVHGRVNNVDIFVDKYVEGKKFMGIMLSTWDKIGGQAWVLCAGLLVMAAVSGIFYQVDREAMLITFFIGIWTVIVDIVVDNIANLAEKRNQIKRNLTDYFDNHAWDGMEPVAQMQEEDEEDFSQEEAFWEDGNPEGEEAEEDFDQSAAFARENSIGQGEKAQEEGVAEMDGYAGAIRIRHLLKPDDATKQNCAVSANSQNERSSFRLAAPEESGRSMTGSVDFQDWNQNMEMEENPAQTGNHPKFYVVSGAERKVPHETEYARDEAGAWRPGDGAAKLREAEYARNEAETKRMAEDAKPEQEAKKVRKESKKELAARKKREHMKYELKREITKQDAEKVENTARAEELQQEKKTLPREAVEQLAAALELLKKENALEEAAPLLAAQIGRDQENGALIEEVLREFLV